MIGKLGKSKPAHYAKTLRLEKYLKRRTSPQKWSEDFNHPHNTPSYTFTGPSQGVVGQKSAPFIVKPLSRIIDAVTITMTGKTHTTQLHLHFFGMREQSFEIDPKVAQTITLTPKSNHHLNDPPPLQYVVSDVPVPPKPPVPPVPPIPPVPPVPPVPPPTPGPLPTPPSSVDFEAKIKDWTMLLNDNLGDCVCASSLHLRQVQTAYANLEIVPTDSQALWMYENYCGYNPNNPNSDLGCVIEDVLNGMMVKGVDVVGDGKIKAFMAFDPTNEQLLEDAIYLFDGAKLGLQMPISAQNQTGPGKVWDVPPGGPVGNGAPGSWGGHDVPVVAYNTVGQMFLVITWGAVQEVTWNFIKTYADEAYAILSLELFNSGGLSPENFDLQALEADLAQY